MKRKLQVQRAKRRSRSHPAQVEPNVPLERNTEALKPRNLAEAKHCPNWPLWEQAISEELTTLCKASTWKLEAPLPRANIISMKWVFKAKKDASRKVVWYKAWLVAQGFSQVEGVNYFDTYTPVAKLTSS